MGTFSAKKETVEHEWLIVDACEQPLGRVASRIARFLKGKHKPIYTPHVDTGDYVIVINSDKVWVTGRKTEQKKYYRHSQYPGGIKETTFEKLKAKDSREIIEHAVRGMLPKNSLGRDMFRKLKVYVGATHPHEAQQPVLIKTTEAL